MPIQSILAADIDPAFWRTGLCFVADALESIGLRHEAGSLRNAVSPAHGARELRRVQAAVFGVYQALMAVPKLLPDGGAAPGLWEATKRIYGRAQTAAVIESNAMLACELCEAAADTMMLTAAMGET